MARHRSMQSPPWPAWAWATALTIIFALLDVAANAATPVEVTFIKQASSYSVTRRYAGDLKSRRTASLGFRDPGDIARVYVDLGDSVKKGQLLAELDVRTLQAAVELAQAEVDQATAAHEQSIALATLAAETLRRHEDLRRRGHTSAQAYNEFVRDLEAKRAGVKVAAASIQRAKAALAARAVSLDEARLTAPFDAIVQARNVDEGTLVNPGSEILRLVENAPLEAHVGLPVDVAVGLAPGETHHFSVANQSIEGRLRRVLPEVDATSRSAIAVFDLPSSHLLAAGSVVELVLARETIATGYWLPMEALSESHRGLWSLFALTADNKAERRLVEVLYTENTRAFVRGTLKDGEPVVVRGAQAIVPGQTISTASAVRSADPATVAVAR